MRWQPWHDILPSKDIFLNAQQCFGIQNLSYEILTIIFVLTWPFSSWGQYYKTVFVRNLRIFLQSLRFNRPCWKSLLWTNTLAYYENSYITAAKSFITLASGLNVINFFMKISMKGIFVTFNITTLSIMTLSLSKLCHSAECHSAECRNLFTVMLIVIMLRVIIQSVIMLNVAMPSVIILSVIKLNVVMPSVAIYSLLC